MNRLILFLSSVLSVGQSHAFLHHLYVLEHPQTEQILYVAGDVHIPSNVALKQRSDLLWWQKIVQNDGGVLCLVEDMLTPNHSHSVVQAYIEKTKKDHPEYWYSQLLTGFAQNCIDRDIPCINVEHRQLTTFSFCGWPISSDDVFDGYYNNLDTLQSCILPDSYRVLFDAWL